MEGTVKEFVGCVIFLAGAALAVWLGVWVLFVGGIVQAVDACKVSPIDSLGLALGLLRVVVAPVGWVIFMVTMALAGAAAQD
mgnify:CR=1 FL=1